MSDLALSATGDLEVTKGKASLVTQGPWIAQKLKIRFQFFLGEWFLDRRLGIPYFRDVLVKNPNLPLIRSLFRRVAASTPGVQTLTRFETKIQPNRVLDFSFTAILEDGTDLDFGFGEFVVEVPS